MQKHKEQLILTHINKFKKFASSLKTSLCGGIKMRDYKKEYEKEKESKVSRLVKVKKDDFEKLIIKLNRENKTFSGFVNEQIKKYIKN